MKKTIFIAIVAVLFTMVSCEQKDCVCRYYDHNGAYVAEEDWDGDQISPSQCQAMENNTSVEVNDQIIVASTVSCTNEW